MAIHTTNDVAVEHTITCLGIIILINIVAWFYIVKLYLFIDISFFLSNLKPENR